MLAIPQSSVAVATPVTFVVVTAGHSKVRSVGQVMIGELVSFTNTSVVQIVGQPLVLLIKLRVKFVPQPVPAVAVTVLPLLAPEIDPFPLMDHEYDVIPAGPLNVVLERGQTSAGPVIEQGLSGFTVSTISLVSVHPLDS